MCIRDRFIAVPDWYYNIEYKEELYRGYEGHEDLFVPGFFEVSIRKGESIILSASTSEQKTSTLARKFNTEIKRRPPRENIEECLMHSAHQFLVKNGKKTELIAGYPWYGSRGRDTLLALPGLTLGRDDPKTCKQILDSFASTITEATLSNPEIFKSKRVNTADTPLCFAWAVHKYLEYIGNSDEVWTSYAKKLKTILKAYRDGLMDSIIMNPNGLLWVQERGYPLTWMNAVANGRPVTARVGYQVETNALWYNAIRFTVALARQAKDHRFAKEWEAIGQTIETSFREVFWYEEKGYLADFVNQDGQNVYVRPNQLFAVSLPYSPLTDEMKQGVLEVVERELYTPKGIRTLAPKNPFYKGRYTGDRYARDLAYHQGTAWPWLLGHFIEAYYKLHGKTADALANSILEAFCEDIHRRGICSISEVYDGDPPQYPKGAISFALSVAEAIRIKRMYESNK